jgi:hypothetical protein
MLAIRDVDDEDLLREVWILKQWCFRVGSTESGSDLVCRYLKYLVKVCQSLFLSVPIPEREEMFPKVSIFHKVWFLEFIGTMMTRGFRTESLTRRTAFILAQLSQMGRAGPYPSHNMVKDMISKVFDMIKDPAKAIPSRALREHRAGLSKIIERLGVPEVSTTHVSLSGSGCLEWPREKGGKGAYMADLARKFSSNVLTIEDLDVLPQLVDCFGDELIAIDVAEFAKRRIISGQEITLGSVVYVPFLECVQWIELKHEVPYGLAKIMMLVASEDIQKYGSYRLDKVPNRFGTPVFMPGRKNKFIPSINAIPVKAAISIEAAMKSRLVTSNPAAYVQLGQPKGHFMREWLSLDPFCRVGFEEGDKLWELLKSYSKYHSKGHFARDREQGKSVDFTVKRAD